jgi:hypothetical protein
LFGPFRAVTQEVIVWFWKTGCRNPILRSAAPKILLLCNGVSMDFRNATARQLKFMPAAARSLPIFIKHASKQKF